MSTPESGEPTGFRAYHLPPEVPPGSERELPLAGVAGPEAVLRIPTVSNGAAEELFDELEKAGRALRRRTNRELVGLLGEAGARLLDPKDPLRRQAEAWLPAEAGLSGPMARLLLDRMASDWTAEALERLLAEEFPDPAVLEGFRPGPAPDRVRAAGEAAAFHLGAGNVAGVGATSLVRSLLVRSAVLLKPGRGDVVLPCLLARALAEADPELGRAVAVVYWPGGSDPPLLRTALRRAGRVVVYGGEATARAVRERLPATRPLVVYGHRVSAGAVGRDALGDEATARGVARRAAEAVAAYDQRGCVSPHQVWVEGGGTVTPERFAELVAQALEALRSELPPGPVEAETAARVQQLRGAAEMGAVGTGATGTGAVGTGAAGTGAAAMNAAGGPTHRVLAPEGSVAWTVILEPGDGIEAGCGARLVRIHPLADLGELPGFLAGAADRLQSVAVEGADSRLEEIAEALAALGVTRVTTFGRQAWPAPWWTHDGQGPLRALVRWTTVERPEG